jgi:large-conductance mechanosensitive channel
MLTCATAMMNLAETSVMGFNESLVVLHRIVNFIVMSVAVGFLEQNWCLQVSLQINFENAEAYALTLGHFRWTNVNSDCLKSVIACSAFSRIKKKRKKKKKEKKEKKEEKEKKKKEKEEKKKRKKKTLLGPMQQRSFRLHITRYFAFWNFAQTGDCLFLVL